MKTGRILFVLCLFFFVSACGEESESAVPPVESIETTNRADIEANTDILIPSDAEELHGYIEGFREVTIYIKFSMQPSDLDSLINSTVCQLPLQENNGPWDEKRPLYNLEWWNPWKARDYLWCYGTQENTHQTILVDTTSSQQYIVFIMDAWY